MAHAPTPFYPLRRLSRLWGGEIWVKRDDLTGMELSGNKVRKLEYLLAQALERGADTIITCGGIQSNHCRATTFACARLGLKVVLLLRGELPDVADGNYYLDLLGGAQVNFITPDDYYHRLPESLEEVAQKVREDGGKPYIIPEGGSNALGAWGYVEAIRELHAQCRQAGVEPHTIVIPSSSGGTHAGLFAGTRREGWEVKVCSAAVSEPTDETRKRISHILEEMNATFNLNLHFRGEDIWVDDQFIGEGYAQASSQDLQVIGEVARTEGVVLDPVYTGKAARMLKERLKEREIATPVVFWHTGGLFGLFSYRQRIKELVDGR
ncbi:MAG: 1-aminocyclopropane-1-carboxylate deaminase/D-cysteine desulfhydrase [bacterium]